MNKQIEWGAIQHGKNIVQGEKGVVFGLFGGIRICSIMACQKNGKNNLTLTFMSNVYEGLISFEDAKDKAEELLQDWLSKAGLMVVPESCNKCRDSGTATHEPCDESCEYETICVGYCIRPVLCSCTENQNSVFSFLKKIREKVK